MGSEATQFKTGNSVGKGGRPKGNRAKLGEAYLKDLKEVWEKEGKTALYKAFKDNPAAMAATIAKILPKELHVEHDLGEDLRSFLENIQQDKPKTIEGQVIDGQAIEDKPETLQ